MATDHLPILIVGDVPGDLERLLEPLEPYPPDRWRTIFLGDLVDYGMFGVGALRFARDRPNSDTILGNHEVALLWALRDPSRIGWWISVGGQRHDLDELAKDHALEDWLTQRPALIKLEDGTLVQHCGHDGYKQWLPEINTTVTRLIKDEREDDLWDVLSAKNVFANQPLRLQQWLQATNSRRVVFGHTPHGRPNPESYHDGTAINFDGAFSRNHKNHKRSPVAASIAPLQPLS